MTKTNSAMLMASVCGVALALGRGAFAQTASTDTDRAPVQTATPPAAADEIVVTGIRGSAIRSQAIKRNAASVVEAVTLEDLGKFSDQNIADVLQRVPGVQIERNDSGVAGDRASIRGLGPSYVQVTVNGRVPLTTGNEGVVSLRQVNLDVIPTEIVSGLLVYKTPTADLVETGLAGSLELQTLRPLDYKIKNGTNYFGSVTTRGDYDDQTNKFSPRISGVIGGKLMDGTLGFYVSGVWARTPVLRNELFSRFANRDLSFSDDGSGKVTRIEKGVLVPSQITTSQNRGVENRLALSGGVQWKPSDQIEINAEFAYSKFFNDQNRPYGDLQLNNGANSIYNGVALPGGYTTKNGLLLAFDTSKLVYPGTVPTVGYDAYPLRFDNDQKSYVGGLNIAYKGERFKAKLDYGYSQADFLQELRTFVGGTPAPNLNVLYDGRPEVPIISGVTNVNHPAGSTQFVFFARDYVNHSNTNAVRADLEYEASSAIRFQAGARFQQTHVNVSSDVIVSVAPDAVTGFTSDKLGPLNSALYPGGNSGFLSDFGFGIAEPQQDYNAGANLVPGLRDARYTAANTDPAFGFRANEKTTALYIQGDATGTFLGMPIDGNAGLRAVYTDLTSSAFTTTTVVTSRLLPVSQTRAPTTDTNRYWRLLPSFNMNLHPRDNINVRASVSRVMSRPEYEDTAPRNALQFLDPNDPNNDLTQNATGSAGNTKLRPLTAWQYDATVEYYTPSKGAFYASFFYKDVSDFIIRTVDTNVTLPGQGSTLFNVTRPVNASSGRVTGFELGLDQPFTFLPAPFDGLGVQANYTYVGSKLSLSTNSNLKYGFPGASKDNANAVLYYEKAGFGVRLAYAYRSNYFEALGGGNDRSAQPTFTKGYGQLNASVSYRLTPNFEINGTTTNITGANRRDYIIDQSQFRSFIQRSRIYSVALRAIY